MHCNNKNIVLEGISIISVNQYQALVFLFITNFCFHVHFEVLLNSYLFFFLYNYIIFCISPSSILYIFAVPILHISLHGSCGGHKSLLHEISCCHYYLTNLRVILKLYLYISMSGRQAGSPANFLLYSRFIQLIR